MPDPLELLKAAFGAAATAAVLLLLCGWPWRRPNPARAAVGWALGIGTGFVLGWWLLGPLPSWPPTVDQGRFLYLLLPAVVLVELLAALPLKPLWLPWMLRFAVAAAAAPLLLHGTSYLVEGNGPGTPGEWTASQTWLILGGLGLALALGWFLLGLLAVRTPSRALPLTLALACGGAGVAIMYSSYTTGGQLGFPLAGALAGAATASFLLPGSPGMQAAVGPGYFGLFALLVLGRFFGQLTTLHAALLFAAPLLAWGQELPRLRLVRPWIWVTLWVIVAAVPVILVMNGARQQFLTDSQREPVPGEVSPQDYEDFGK